MIALSLLVIAALVASSVAKKKSSSSSSPSTSSHDSTDNNEARKAFARDNLRDFEDRLNTAVAKALLNPQFGDIDEFVRPFLKTYGVKSDREFETTLELLKAAAVTRKRNTLSDEDEDDSSSSSSSSSPTVRLYRVGPVKDAVDKLVDKLGNGDKNAFRLAVIKEALVQHLRHGR